MLLKLARLGWILAFVFTLAVWPVYGIIAANAVTAYRITPYDEEEIKFNREVDMPEKNDPEYEKKIVELYGMTSKPLTQEFVVGAERIRHPEELPNVNLLPIDLEKEEPPLQLKTVLFGCKGAFFISFGCGFLVFIIWVLLLRFAKPTSPAPSA